MRDCAKLHYIAARARSLGSSPRLEVRPGGRLTQRKFPNMALSTIPSVDRLLNAEALQPLLRAHGRRRVTAAIREHLTGLRSAGSAALGADATSPDRIASAVGSALATQALPSLRRVANLTGTVLHTNLGRAQLPQAAIDAMSLAAREPCNLEYDLADGLRGERDAHVESSIVALTGAEAALVVNNNAAAVFLVLNTLALRREVVVSRGELVEIGGQFRIPDIMVRAGARLREVGTTNRTHLSDYAGAMTPRTALCLKVHTSNYEVRGFTSSVGEAELAQLAHEHGIPMAADLGSGTLLDLRQWGLPCEPTASAMIAAGADLVTFSGDKLLGGPQCGIVAGRKALIEKLRGNPLKRALRVDKLILAALEQVLRLYLDPDELAAKLPTLRLLTRTKVEIEPTARRIADAVAAVLPPPYAVTVITCASRIGSGALPVATLPSAGVRVASTSTRRHRDRDIQRLHRALRQLPLPIVGRIEDQTLILDCRCVDHVEEIVAQLGRLDLAAAGPEGQAGK